MLLNPTAVVNTNDNGGVTWDLFMYMGLLVLAIIGLSCGIIYAVLKFFPEQ